MDIANINRKAWNKEVETNNYWTLPVGPEVIKEAKKGNLAIHLTPEKFVKKEWYEKINGDVLALASGGGQQAPQFAAKGCRVTLLDNSDMQLEQDRIVIQREHLEAVILQGDMRDLSAFEDESFNVVFNPISINFIPDVDTMYKEVYRVLKKGGYFFTAFANPVLYIFDEKKEVEKHKLKVKYTLPFSTLTSKSEKEVKKLIAKKETLEFSHTLQTLIGDLLTLGFTLEGFETDHSLFEPVDSFIQDAYIALMCRKL